MLSVLFTCFSFLLPIFLLVGTSELRRKYRNLKQKDQDLPGSVSPAELKKWKWLYIGATVVFWTVVVMLAAIPALFFVAISFM